MQDSTFHCSKCKGLKLLYFIISWDCMQLAGDAQTLQINLHIISQLGLMKILGRAFKKKPLFNK